MPHSCWPDAADTFVLMRVVEHRLLSRWCISYTRCAHSPCIVLHVVTAKTQYNLKNAQEYFEEHLAVGDYYAEGQRVSGEWIGMGGGVEGDARRQNTCRYSNEA